MTVIPPKLTTTDRLLRAMGKKRGVVVPGDGKPYTYYQLQKESFFKALFRPAGKNLPPGYTDIFDLM